MTLAFLHSSGRLASLVLGTTSSKSSSSGTSTLILFVLLFAAMYFLWLRPQRKKLQARQLSQVRSVDVGDEVVTQSGIIGTVVSIDEDRAEIQVANGVTISVVRAAIGRRIEPVIPESQTAGFDDVETDEVDDTPQPPTRFWQRRSRGADE